MISIDNRLLGGILLVSGTTIGAGMLALPVITGFAGFLPTLILLAVFWVYMTYTAFLILESTLWMDEHTNLITLAKKTLGRGGEVFSWFTYLFLLYSLTTAYIAGSGPIVTDFIEGLTGMSIPPLLGSLPLLLIFGTCVYRGTKSVDYTNRILMIGLVIAFLLIVIFLFPHVDPILLRHVDWKYLAIADSIVATSYGFHIVIPSLTNYLKRDVKQLKKAILIGSAIPLIVYMLWITLSLGIIPLEGPYGIRQGYAEGANGAHLLTEHLGHSALGLVTRCFSFFAIVTSFLGVSLSLTDFLADGLKIKRNKSGRTALYALTFMPPVVITLLDPRAFLTALEFAGAFGVVIILGFMPALMVWRGRYLKHFSSVYKTPGGKTALIAAMIFSIFVILLEIGNQAGWVGSLIRG